MTHQTAVAISCFCSIIFWLQPGGATEDDEKAMRQFLGVADEPDKHGAKDAHGDTRRLAPMYKTPSYIGSNYTTFPGSTLHLVMDCDQCGYKMCMESNIQKNMVNITTMFGWGPDGKTAVPMGSTLSEWGCDKLSLNGFGALPYIVRDANSGAIYVVEFDIGKHMAVLGDPSTKPGNQGECLPDTSETFEGSTEGWRWYPGAQQTKAIATSCCHYHTNNTKSELPGMQRVAAFRPECKIGLNYDEAVDHCAKYGLQLCSKEEIEAGILLGTGCDDTGHDGTLNWARDPCQTPHDYASKTCSVADMTPFLNCSGTLLSESIINTSADGKTAFDSCAAELQMTHDAQCMVVGPSMHGLHRWSCEIWDGDSYSAVPNNYQYLWQNSTNNTSNYTLTGVTPSKFQYAITASDFKTRCQATQYPIQTGKTNYGIYCDEFIKGEGYIMYTAEAVTDRFSPWGNVTLAPHFACVHHSGTEWIVHYPYSSMAFTTVPTDVLVAEVNFDLDTVTSLQGVSGTYMGIHMGFKYGDLNFIPKSAFYASTNETNTTGQFELVGDGFYPNEVKEVSFCEHEAETLHCAQYEALYIQSAMVQCCGETCSNASLCDSTSSGTPDDRTSYVRSYCDGQQWCKVGLFEEGSEGGGGIGSGIPITGPKGYHTALPCGQALRAHIVYSCYVQPTPAPTIIWEERTVTKYGTPCVPCVYESTSQDVQLPYEDLRGDPNGGYQRRRYTSTFLAPLIHTFSTCQLTNDTSPDVNSRGETRTDPNIPWCCTASEPGNMRRYEYVEDPKSSNGFAFNRKDEATDIKYKPGAWEYCFIGFPTAKPTPAPTLSPTSIDCIGEWGKWGKCSKTCGVGVQKRVYKITQQASGGGAECRISNDSNNGKKKAKKRCMLPKCPTPAPTAELCAAAPAMTKYAKNTAKMDRQCQKKCNFQSRRRMPDVLKKCKKTCHKCNEMCSCTETALASKTKQKERKGKGAKNANLENKWGRILREGA